MKCKIASLLILLSLITIMVSASPVSTQQPAATTDTPVTYPWVPDQGDGTFRNPIICADYSDPDVVRHGADFYMTASSFNSTPGLPILHSRDLVNWTIINHALSNLPHARYGEVRHGEGVWAPAIRFHAGKFWIFFPTPDEGIYVTTASNPAGRWSKPHLLQPGKGLIDPCPLWDDDGKAYLVFAYAGSRAGINSTLRVSPMAPDGSRLLGQGQVVYHNPQKHPTLEGPKFLKKDGWYYILAPAGGVTSGWQTVFRSRQIYGPYEDKIVLEQGSTSVNGPHQGALVDLPGGDASPSEWWFVHFQDAGVYGRITHLQPVQWKEGWPLMGLDLDGNGIGEPVLHQRKPNTGRNYPITTPQTSDEFNFSRLGMQWQWHANHQNSWHSLNARPGYLRLPAQYVVGADLSKTPNLLLQKFPARAFVAETAMTFAPTRYTEEAGLIVMGQEHAALALRRTQQGTQIVLRVNNAVKFTADFPATQIKLRVEVQPGGLCTFSYATPGGEFNTIPETFQAQRGRWIGAKVGLYSLMHHQARPVAAADFEYFRFFKPNR